MLLLAALPSCTTLPGPEAQQAAAWKAEHAAFRATEGWKKNSFVNEGVVAKLKPETTSIKVHLYEQRGLMLHEGKHVAIDFPVSSGRRSFPTTPGSYTVIEKKLKHSSNLYGKYVEIGTGKVLASDVDTSSDPMPENASYVGSPMPYFMRLTNKGLGLHIGVVPGYPASHGCIRVPRKIMPRVYALTPAGTAVEVIKSAPEVPETDKSKEKKSPAKVASN
jgi:hypothetical protein